MFLDNTKIKVVDSTVPAKKTGPKKGSVGYIISNRLKHSVKFTTFITPKNPIPHGFSGALIGGEFESIRLIPIDDIDFFVEPATVFFTKYGGDTNTRFERKNVINVVCALLSVRFA